MGGQCLRAEEERCLRSVEWSQGSLCKFTCNPYIFIMTSHPWQSLSLGPQNKSSPQPVSECVYFLATIERVSMGPVDPCIDFQPVLFSVLPLIPGFRNICYLQFSIFLEFYSKNNLVNHRLLPLQPPTFKFLCYSSWS